MSREPGIAGQIRLAALLRYFQQGDFVSFRKSCELALGDELVSSPYYCADLLLAAQIGGLCDVGSDSGTIKWWWAAHEGDINIRSLRPKQIGVSAEWLDCHKGPPIPLIARSDGVQLMLGARLDTKVTFSTTIFSSGLDQLLPSYKVLESQLCEPMALHDDFPGWVEAYCPETGSWEHSAVDMSRGAQLLKAQRKYSGVSFYVQNIPLGVRVKIKDPSWAFFIAFFLLGWPLASLFRVEGTTLRLWRAVKLPAVMGRLLFANAQLLRIGPQIVFEDVHPRCIDGALAYLTRTKDRE